MGKYDGLTSYLEAMPMEPPELSLRFGELESALGAPLPPTARADRTWWANTVASPQGFGWLKALWRVTRVDLAAERVVFTRLTEWPAQPRSGGLGGSYEGLRQFLASVPAQQKQLALTLAEVAALRGRDLPPSAFSDRIWWSNDQSFSQSVAWVSAGWNVSKVYFGAQIVVFRRTGEDPVRLIPRYVQGLLNGARRLAKPGVRDLARWIRFCRRVEWFFEATVLYERSGVLLDSLPEIDRTEVEEDYSACKRELLRYRNDAGANRVAGAPTA